MDRNQINNIIGFAFAFHRQCDVKLEDQSPDYIMEKWGKYIGCDSISNFINVSYYDIPGDMKRPEIDIWIKRWKVSKETFLKMKEIIYLISIINSKALLDKYDIGKYNTWDLESLIEEFSKYIDIKSVNKEFYNHQHSLVQREVVRWLNKTENKRAYNLSLIIV